MENWIHNLKILNGNCRWKRSCLLCNQWILKGEKFYSIFVPTKIKKKYGLENFSVHKEEWDSFIECLSEEEIIKKILNHKKPQRKKLNNQQLNDIECFKKACGHYGFNKYIISKDKRFIKAKKKKTSFTIIYDFIFDEIGYETRESENLFEQLSHNRFIRGVSDLFCEYQEEQKNINDIYLLK